MSVPPVEPPAAKHRPRPRPQPRPASIMAMKRSSPTSMGELHHS